MLNRSLNKIFKSPNRNKNTKKFFNKSGKIIKSGN